MTFFVALTDGSTETVEADFMTEPLSALKFWSKPRWYRRARMVAIYPVCRVSGVRNLSENENWLKQARVKV
jgi:hypothetical protein